MAAPRRHEPPWHLPTITATIEALAREDPARIAFVTPRGALGYGELARAVRRVAAFLAGQGIGPGMRVAVTLRDDMDHAVVALALLRLGCRQVTFASMDPGPMRAALAERLSVEVLVADGPQDAVPGPALLLPDIPRLLADAALDARPLPPALPQGGSLIFPSSGTTGRPKLVEADEALIALQGRITAGLGVRRSRLAGNEFNYGKRLLLQTFGSGDTEILIDAKGWAGIAEACARGAVDRLNVSPQRLEALVAESAAPGFPGWPPGTALVATGGALSGGLRREVVARVTPNLLVLYGATETGPISIARPEAVLDHPDSVGRPCPEVAVRIVDDAGRPLPPGERGLIRIRTPAGVTRYLDDPEATARAFHGGWFEPGDVCAQGPGGALVYAGRADDMMNLGSIKIFPAEIEAAAAGFPGLVECAAFAWRAPALGDVPVLAAVAREGFDPAALLAHCRARLGLRAPRRVLVLPALPRNAVGKVLRRDLARLTEGDLPPGGR